MRATAAALVLRHTMRARPSMRCFSASSRAWISQSSTLLPSGITPTLPGSRSGLAGSGTAGGGAGTCGSQPSSAARISVARARTSEALSSSPPDRQPMPDATTRRWPALDLAELLALGERLGAAAHGGEVLLLSGPMGAGKTTLVRALA